MKFEIDEAYIANIEYLHRFIKKNPENVSASLIKYHICEKIINELTKQAVEQNPKIFDTLPDLK